MYLSYLLVSSFVTPLVGAYLISPPGTAAPGATADCSEWVQQSYGLTCAIIEEFYGMTEAQFEAWNPSTTELGPGCTLISGLYYCVQINFSTMSTLSTGPPTASATTSMTTTSMTVVATTTSTGDGISTPTPHQTGMASNCNSFYLVVSGDTCDTITAKYGISLTLFYTWNPAVGSDCQFLDLGDYVCVDVIGATPTAIVTSTTSPSNGITTPTPYQAGMVTNCDRFHLVASGDQCGDIATKYDISLAQFYSWNPAVGSSCQYLDLGDYVCIGVETCTSASVLAGVPQGGVICGAPGASHDNSGSLLIISYTSGSYVQSAAACGAQCIATSGCTNLYFIQGSYCNLHEGASTFAESTVSPYYIWYDAACFAGNNTCGIPGASHDNSGSLLITSYTAGSPYVESAAACGAQCLTTPSCTNLYFIEGSYCNLHEGASTFAESTSVSPVYYWYSASCFSSGDACGSYGFSDDNPTTLIISYTSGSYVQSAAACGAQCLSTSGCTDLYFIQGSYCNLHSPSSFYASTASGYYSWYQSDCFACNALSV